jgi:hypothetical protein
MVLSALIRVFLTPPFRRHQPTGAASSAFITILRPALSTRLDLQIFDGSNFGIH